MNNKVAIVVTYNRKELLCECLDALLSQTEPVDVLIIDNGSTDGTGELVKNSPNYSKMQYINTERNLGGAGGFSFGIKKAYELGYEYFWLMDDDTIPEKDALSELCKAEKKLEGKNWGFLGSLVMWNDKEVCVMNFPSPHNDWYKEAYLVNDGLLQISNTSFVSCYLKREVVKEFGLPIKEFVIWKDDVEYTERISEKMPCYFVPASRVIHKIKNNIATPIEKDSPDRLWRYRCLYRNWFYIARRKGSVEILRFYVNAFRAISHIIKSDCSQKSKRIFAVLGGITDGWGFRPEIDKV